MDMLEDRNYMRRSSFEAWRSATLFLIVANLVAFGVQCLAYGYPLRISPGNHFALSVAGLRHGEVWQLLTFQFMHGGLLHLLFNCFAIFMFGRSVEQALGRKSFLTLYFSAGVIGGLFQGLAGAIFGGRFAAPVVGASAGAFGLIAAFAVLYPQRPLTVFIFFIPINMRARTLLVVSIVLAIVGIIFPIQNVADAAHLGGILTGVLFVRWAVNWSWQLPQFRKKNDRPLRRLVKVHSQKPPPWGSSSHPEAEELTPEEFLRQQVDPILEKISAHGIQSLSENERNILEAARKRMAKR
jgi:membrane associated rhomboid family serine protease